jgi:tetratricopeptide (TPR) repeat protein
MACTAPHGCRSAGLLSTSPGVIKGGVADTVAATSDSESAGGSAFGGLPRSGSRAIRVFVSSTFADMRHERDELVKHVFPKLRDLCDSRGVVCGEVDLRWGITDEQRDEGLVLPICLQEIRECRPYFIGLLGERYGFVPTLPAALFEHEPWLEEHEGKSVTELEIIHGVLADPSMADHAFFYFRDPAYIPDEAPLAWPPSDPSAYGDPDDPEKLAALKDRIRNSGLPVRENYADPAELGQLVLDDLTAVVDRLFPAGSEPTPLEREGFLHDGFRRSRAGVFIGRSTDFARLDEHIAGIGPPLVVVGESGIGKSALLANWAERFDEFRERALLESGCDAPFLVTHFVAASPASADWAAMVRRIVTELSDHFELGIEPGDSVAALHASLADALNRSAAHGRVVLIVDALDQLEDQDGAPDLVWLPPVIPPQVRLIVSTLPGRALDELVRRGWPTMEIRPLDPVERERLIHDYLKQYTKTLPEEFVREISDAPQSASPLFLRTLLEELRIYGDHATLQQLITRLLRATDIGQLFELILSRWERDYESARPRLVRDALRLLASVKFGLTERELLDILGEFGQPLPQAHWSELYLAAKPVLSNRNGLIGFTHNYARTAVAQRFMRGAESRREAHLTLAGYFEARPYLRKRELDELLWQMASAQQWDRLYHLLASPQLLESLGVYAPFELRRYWAQVEAASPLRMVDAYRPLLDDGADIAPTVAAVLTTLLNDMGHRDEALALDGQLTERYRAAGATDLLAESLGRRAAMLQSRGDLNSALAHAAEAQRVYTELGDLHGVQRIMGTRAHIMRDEGNLTGALEVLHEQERICRELGSDMGLQASLADQALCLRRRGDLDAAMALSEEGERISRRLGFETGVLSALGLQALICTDRREFDAALALHKRVEELASALGDRELVQSTIQNQGAVHLVRGNLDTAADMYARAEQICRELGQRTSLQFILANQANILLMRGDLDGATAVVDEHEALCRELGTPDGLAASLDLKRQILERRGDLDGAIAKLSEEERLWRELGRLPYLQVCLGNKARLLECRGERGDLEEAAAVLQEHEALCRQLDERDGLQHSLAIQARLLNRRDDVTGAIAKLTEQERICRELGQLDDLLEALRFHAALLAGNPQEAVDVLVESVATSRSLGDFDGALELLGLLSVIVRDRGDIEAALRVQDEREAILRERGDLKGCAACMTARAILRRDRGDTEAAIAELEESERILRQIGDSAELTSALGVRAVILQDRGDTQGALTLFEECAALARTHDDPRLLLMILDQRVALVRATGDLNATLAAISEREVVFRALSEQRPGVPKDPT